MPYTKYSEIPFQLFLHQRFCNQNTPSERDPGGAGGTERINLNEFKQYLKEKEEQKVQKTIINKRKDVKTMMNNLVAQELPPFMERAVQEVRGAVAQMVKNYKQLITGTGNYEAQVQEAEGLAHDIGEAMEDFIKQMTADPNKIKLFMDVEKIDDATLKNIQNEVVESMNENKKPGAKGYITINKDMKHADLLKVISGPYIKVITASLVRYLKKMSRKGVIGRMYFDKQEKFGIIYQIKALQSDPAKIVGSVPQLLKGIMKEVIQEEIHSKSEDESKDKGENKGFFQIAA